jgi:hypothetical protein
MGAVVASKSCAALAVARRALFCTADDTTEDQLLEDQLAATREILDRHGISAAVFAQWILSAAPEAR